MNRRFAGFFRGLSPTSRPDLIATSRPRIEATVFFGRGRLRTPFLIDTGADFTVLQPDHAWKLLRRSQERIPETETADTFAISGIGTNIERVTVRRVGLRFVDVNGDAYWFAQSILFADDPASTGWNVPSVLGRDVLSRFHLDLDYDPPTVSLTLNA